MYARSKSFRFGGGVSPVTLHFCKSCGHQTKFQDLKRNPGTVVGEWTHAVSPIDIQKFYYGTRRHWCNNNFTVFRGTMVMQ